MISYYGTIYKKKIPDETKSITGNKSMVKYLSIIQKPQKEEFDIFYTPRH
jgi:hypothetical protein